MKEGHSSAYSCLSRRSSSPAIRLTGRMLSCLPSRYDFQMISTSHSSSRSLLYFAILCISHSIMRLLLLLSSFAIHSTLARVQNEDQSLLKEAHIQNPSSSLLQFSIFRRQNGFGKQALPQEPIPPTYYMRDSDYEPNFSGINTFAHLNYTNCFAPENNGTFDIAIVGAPFDLGVSYRPGARFGPTGARMGARRISPGWGWE